ncbi:MAG TPA: hypothetical protein VH740_22275 [Vicinamibacterales bacterium]
MSSFGPRSIAVGLVALTCGQACATHAGPASRSAGSLPVAKSLGATVEASDPALAAALLKLRLAPTAAHHRAAAAQYRRLRIDDTAFDHLSAAIRLEPNDAGAYDERARIWRDWGYPELGMTDAARAVFLAPRSAAAHNTRGTLLAAAGDLDGALLEFGQALILDPKAPFAAANLCYLERTTKSTDAIRLCSPTPAARDDVKVKGK